MKGILIPLLLLSFLPCLAQEEEQEQDTAYHPPIGSKEYYLNKSINQKKNGRLLLIGGTGMICAGIIAGNSGTEKPGDLGFGPSFETGVTLLVLGLLVDLAGILSFAASAKNARRAVGIKEGDSTGLNGLENKRRGRKSAKANRDADVKEIRYKTAFQSTFYSDGFSNSLISGY